MTLREKFRESLLSPTLRTLRGLREKVGKTHRHKHTHIIAMSQLISPFYNYMHFQIYVGILALSRTDAE